MGYDLYRCKWTIQAFGTYDQSSSWWDLLLRFTSAFANFIRSRLEDLAFVVVSRTSSGRSFQAITILAQVQARHPFPQILTDIIISWKIRNFITRWVMACESWDFHWQCVGCWNMRRLCIKQYHSWRPSNDTLSARTRKPRRCSSWVVLAVTIVNNCFSFDYCEYPSISSWSHYSLSWPVLRWSFVLRSGRQVYFLKKVASTRSKIYPGI